MLSYQVFGYLRKPSLLNIKIASFTTMQPYVFAFNTFYFHSYACS